MHQSAGVHKEPRVCAPMTGFKHVAGSANSSSSARPANTFLRSSRTLQHRQMLTTGSSADSSGSQTSAGQSSGSKFGRVARVGAYGVAAAPPPGMQPGEGPKHYSLFALSSCLLTSHSGVCCSAFSWPTRNLLIFTRMWLCLG